MDSGTRKSADVYDFAGWLLNNRTRLAWAGGAVAAAGLAVSYFAWQAGAREVDAGEALSMLRPTQNASGGSTPVSAQEYFKVAEKYPKTSAGGRALLLGAGVLFSEGKYDQAYLQFANILGNYDAAALRPMATLGIAASLDAQGKIPEATARYKEVIDRYPREPAATQAKSALARLYELQDRPQEAMKLYQELVQGGDVYGSVSLEAQVRLERLSLKQSALVTTNAPTLPAN